MGTWRRVAVALGLAADTRVREIYRVYEERSNNRVPLQVVEKNQVPLEKPRLHSGTVAEGVAFRVFATECRTGRKGMVVDQHEGRPTP